MCSVTYGHHDSGKRIRSNFRERDFGGAMEEGVGVGGVLNKYSESYAEGGLPLGWQWLGFSFHVPQVRRKLTIR